MPLLDKGGAKADTWTLLEDGQALTAANTIVPLARAGEIASRSNSTNPVGLLVAGNTKIADIVPFLADVQLVAIAFPAFSDGRGFSLARLIRRAGFKGTLRACGTLIADQFAYALGVGFDEIDLPEAVAARQPVEQWLKAGAIVSNTYQRGYISGGNILDQRRAAREGKPA